MFTCCERATKMLGKCSFSKFLEVKPFVGVQVPNTPDFLCIPMFLICVKCYITDSNNTRVVVKDNIIIDLVLY